MLTEERKKVFKENLDKTFNIAKSIIDGKEIKKENIDNKRIWLRNLYARYTNAKHNVNPNHSLPPEHLVTLESKLKEENLTLEDFEKAHGKIELLVEIIKNNKTTPKEDSLEDLEQLRTELEDKISKLEKKHTPKSKSLYHYSDEDYEKLGNELSTLYEKRKELNKKIEKLTPKEEVIEEKVGDCAKKKIEELIADKKRKEAEIIELKNELAKQREERAYYSNKYREESEREFEIHKKQLEEEFDKKVKDEVAEQIKKNNQKELETTKLQKIFIRKLFFKGECLSLEDIKSKLKAAKIPTSKLDIAFNELRIEIPGIIKQIDKDGLMQVYTIGAKANDRLEALKKYSSCPRISNVFDGTVKFIIDPDPHVLLESTEDEMKKAREPYYQYSSANKNIPIIGLGDYSDTYRNIQPERWKTMDPEAIKYSYHFYETFAKVMATAPNTNNYLLIGNHDEHPYLVGIDPIEIMNNNCNNITFLGIDKGQFMLGNDKMGVFHGVDSVPYIHRAKKGLSKQQVQQQTYETICEEIKNIIDDNIYALIAHYHFGIHNPHKHFSVVYNPLLCTAEIEDGHVKRMLVQGLNLTKKENNFVEDPYQTEIYNSSYQYKKKSH